MAEANTEYSRPIIVNGRYRNPWDTWTDPKFHKLFQFMFMKSNANIPTNVEELSKNLPVIKPELTQFRTSPEEGVRHLWIGHASSLVQFDGFTFLTDPIFSNRCSPSQWFGPKRYRPPPCTIEELPDKLDCVLISHNHYDHLDYSTVMALNHRYKDRLRWYVPMGMKKWMNDCGCHSVVELSWWEEYLHSEVSQIKVVSTPCQHWSKRTINDDNMTLWSSWCVIGPKNNFFFAGDTGYCPGFKQIGSRYGPFTLSTIPIGAYEPRWFLSPQHVNPKEAVQIHTDVKSQISIGIHWGTFALASKEFYLEPKYKLQEELAIKGLDPETFITVKHGEITVVGWKSTRNS